MIVFVYVCAKSNALKQAAKYAQQISISIFKRKYRKQKYCTRDLNGKCVLASFVQKLQIKNS